MKDFPVILKRFRLANGISFEALANAIGGYTPEYILKVELHEQTPAAEFIEAVKAAIPNIEHALSMFACQSCVLYQAIDVEKGECHLAPPQPLITGAQQNLGLRGPEVKPVLNCLFPVVGRHSWCGQFRAQS